MAFHANQDSTVEVSSNILQSSADEVQKVRNVMRFALGALNDFKNSVANYNSLHLIDKYLLHLLYSFNKQVFTFTTFQLLFRNTMILCSD